MMARHIPKGLNDTERAYFNAIKQVAASARPGDIRLWRMILDGDTDVAVIVQRVLDEQANEVGWQPLAMIVDDDLVGRLETFEGQRATDRDPDGLEGAA